MNELVNIIAPLLVQLLGAIVLALASAILLKAAPIVADIRTQQGLALVAALAKVFVHTAEVEGVGKTGAEKAVAARQYVNSELAAAGVTSVKAADIEGTVKGAVQQAWADQIGETYHKPNEPVPVLRTEPPAGTPTGQPNADGTYPEQPVVDVPPYWR